MMQTKRLRVAPGQSALLRESITTMEALERQHAQNMRERRIALQSIIGTLLVGAGLPADWQLQEIDGDGRTVTFRAPEAPPDGA